MIARYKHVPVALVLAVAAGTFVQAATAQAPQARAAHAPSAAVLPFEQLERLAAREMAQVTELEVRDLVLKAKGYDARGMKVELLMDRRDGQVLSRRVKYPKHMQGQGGWPAPGVSGVQPR